MPYLASHSLILRHLTCSLQPFHPLPVYYLPTQLSPFYFFLPVLLAVLHTICVAIPWHWEKWLLTCAPSTVWWAFSNIAILRRNCNFILVEKSIIYYNVKSYPVMLMKTHTWNIKVLNTQIFNYHITYPELHKLRTFCLALLGLPSVEWGSLVKQLWQPE